MGFPKNFVWGAASSSYQTEGAWNEDGKGLSVWDAFCREEGKVVNGDTGDIACDSYHRFPEDVAMLKAMGLKAYRFSISWPRIYPYGFGEINEKGFDFYDKLVDLLLENGIEPYLTLFHWELPLSLEQAGGWQNRETVDAFANLAAVTAKHFDGRVKKYFTINEPQCLLWHGYMTGLHAPGKKLQDCELHVIAHNMLVAHGAAVKAIRANSTGVVEIGLATTGRLCYPEKETEENIEAARRLSFEAGAAGWQFTHNAFLDPIVLREYPSFLEEDARKAAGESFESDLELMAEPIDFVGFNIYTGSEVDENGNLTKRYRGFPRTALKWVVSPEVMHYGVRFLYERYKLPVYISESGLSCNDKIYLDGKVHDVERIDYLERYLGELQKSVSDGVDLRGYFHWSLTDNFEWHSGYDERFGLVFVDYRTGERIRKDSSFWFENYIRKHTLY